MANLLMRAAMLAAMSGAYSGTATADAPRPKKIDILIGFDSGGLHQDRVALIIPRKIPHAAPLSSATQDHSFHSGRLP